MQISVASGKGGTGKTTIATNLALAIAHNGEEVTYVDGDVEEPNGHIFLKPSISQETTVDIPIPKIDPAKCTLCGECSAACEYNALAVLGKAVELFPSLCHGCGVCSDVCPEDAIVEVPRRIGTIRHGRGKEITFAEGRLDVGEALSPPVTRALRKSLSNGRTIIIDAPPGTSCPVIEAISGTDFVILVTEPTPFGQNDLELAVGMVRAIGLPFGVLINRSDIGDDRTEKYCHEQGIDILMKIPFRRTLAEAYSRGEMMVDVDGSYHRDLSRLYEDISRRVKHD